MPSRRDVIKATAAAAVSGLPLLSIGQHDRSVKPSHSLKPGDVAVWDWETLEKLIVRHDGHYDVKFMRPSTVNYEVFDAETGEPVEYVMRYDARTQVVERIEIESDGNIRHKVFVAGHAWKCSTIMEHRPCIVREIPREPSYAKVG